MITDPSPASAVGTSPPLCDVRLATRISEGVDRRLRLAALLRNNTPLGQYLDLVLDQALPPVDQLADQIRGDIRDDS